MNATRPLPRFVRIKKLANGAVVFYWDLYYRRLGCSIPSEPLGADYAAACGEDGNGGRAAILNSLFVVDVDYHDAEYIRVVQVSLSGSAAKASQAASPADSA